MQFRDHEYFRCSQERLLQSKQLYEGVQSYALSMYCSGLSVECMLRAFRWKVDDSFEGRHDLKDLLKASGLLRIDEKFMRCKGVDEGDVSKFSKEIRVAVNEVYAIWHNNIRFASENKMQAYLTKIGRTKKIKGDSLKKIAKDQLEAASLIVTRGIVLWN